jgi:hypothetical protein
MSDNIVTEYVENTKIAELSFFPETVRDHEPWSQPDNHHHDKTIVVFEEESPEILEVQEMPFKILDVGDEVDITKFEEDDEEEDGEDEEDELVDTGDQQAMNFTSPGHGEVLHDIPNRNVLPGVVDYVDDIDDVEEEQEVVTNWIKDRDVKHFMSYILDAYPGGIPKHNGDSISKGEKVVQYLTRLNNEVSEALRNDKDDHLDIDSLERMRVNMIRDTALMKKHIKKLQRKHRESIAGLNEETTIIKEATTPRIQLVMTPFERAITGILINSVVSAGKPFEEVYEFLNKKYGFTEREELAIMQLATDMGQPIFKDRGTYGFDHDKSDKSKNGVDFIKNYFA